MASAWYFLHRFSYQSLYDIIAAKPQTHWLVSNLFCYPQFSSQEYPSLKRPQLSCVWLQTTRQVQTRVWLLGNRGISWYSIRHQHKLRCQYVYVSREFCICKLASCFVQHLPCLRSWIRYLDGGKIHLSQRMREQGREVPRVNVSGKFLGYLRYPPRSLALFSIFLAYSWIRYLYSGKIKLS